MRIVLTSKLFQRRDDQGRLVGHHRGDVLDLDDAEALRLVSLDIAVDEADAPTITATPEPVPQVPSAEPEATPVADGPDRPSPAMNREKWDAYARAVGVDPSKFKTKQELIAALP